MSGNWKVNFGVFGTPRTRMAMASSPLALDILRYSKTSSWCGRKRHLRFSKGGLHFKIASSSQSSPSSETSAETAESCVNLGLSLFSKGRPQLEGGDKIIMPPSALGRLASLHIEYPMLFELRNASTERISHCSVLEFIAEEGMVYMPYWMMQNLLLEEGDIAQVKSATLPKGTYVKLQPHTKDFLDISNPKAILERTLRNFSCLTTGDSIMVPYNNKKYYIDILETKPSSANSIIETDCEVNFAPPLDYKEPERPQPSVLSNKSQDAVAESAAEKKHNPFSGSARLLDGKPSTHAPSIPTIENHGLSEASNGSNSSMASASQSSASRKTSGKLVFGSNAGHAPKEAQKLPKEESPKQEEEPKFQAFTGKKYSLKR